MMGFSLVSIGLLSKARFYRSIDGPYSDLLLVHGS